MKKFLFILFLYLSAVVQTKAATEADVEVCKHSYVLVCDEFTNNGTTRPGTGKLFGNNMFLDVTGGSVATSKGKSDPAEKIVESDAEGNVTNEYYRYGEEFAKKYGDLGAHYNSLRIKNAQDVLCMKVT